ncbi:MAG TPA: SAM-dependent methyltransferase, partial [Cyanobacteria bacterium UBA9971]|nr:SAM-dependent methyltransferase [Cyanobacteria bacterium UBA9971]
MKKISELNRKRKWKLFLNLIKPDKDDTILDVGFNETEYSQVDNFLEKNYQYPEKITALGLKEAK